MSDFRGSTGHQFSWIMFRYLENPDANLERRLAIPVLCVDVNNS